ncbi:MAG: hypothetical protein OEV80_18325, partial [candidate division Zixibacteria bacterium]|nr:hypothetical protein [candidate division Zixibacteria bacterium]
IFFAIWSTTAWLLYRLSIRQDSEHQAKMPLASRRISAAGMLLFAITTTLAAFDWLMSLDAHWYSTIFGVYVFSGSFLAVLSFVILSALYMRRRGVLKNVISIEHFHDVGKLTFAFVIFWAYMAFSQYFLIWYGNIPEETVWFLHRWENPWRYISLIIIFGHFVLPFVVLLTRRAKRSPLVLTIMALWILTMRWVDLHWLVLPNLHRHGPHFSWMDISTMIGVGGLFLWYFFRLWSRKALVPVNDPGLEKSIGFVNH